MKPYVFNRTANKIYNKTETYLVTLLFHASNNADKNVRVCLCSIKSIDHSYGKHWFVPRVVCSVNVNIVSSAAKQIYAFHIFSCACPLTAAWRITKVETNTVFPTHWVDKWIDNCSRTVSKEAHYVWNNFLLPWLLLHINFIYLRLQFYKSYNGILQGKKLQFWYLIFQFEEPYDISFFSIKT